MQKSRSIPSSNNNTWLEHQRQNVSQNNHFNTVGFLQQCPVQMLWLHFNHPILNIHIQVLASRCESIEILFVPRTITDRPFKRGVRLWEDKNVVFAVTKDHD